MKSTSLTSFAVWKMSVIGLCSFFMGEPLSFATESHSISEGTVAPPTSTKPLVHSNDQVDFDIDSLKALGYGAEVADFFRDGSQFLPGQHEVTLVVNGSARYSSVVSIGERGQLCMTPALQSMLKLKEVELNESCVALEDIYPSAKTTAHPNTFTIEILVAESDFDPQLRGDELTYGGSALFSNYRVYGMEIKGLDTQRFYQGQFDTGFNWHNWILRNNSSFSSGENETQYQFNETTLTRSIAPWRTLMQLGQISSQGSLFGGTPLNGIQFYSDSALQNTNQLVIPVTGVAETASTVEVMQNGRLLYRTLVPAGPFELDRINSVVSGQPLQVSVLQEDGQHQQFTVMTANQVKKDTLSEPNYQVGIGQYRQRSSNEDIDKPLIVNAEAQITYQQTDYTAGFQFSDRYQSTGGRLAKNWETDYPIGTGFGVQYARNAKKQGQQWDANVNTSLGMLSLGLSSLYRTKDYPTLEETLLKDKPEKIEEDQEQALSSWWQSSETQLSNSASLNIGDSHWGRLGYSVGLTQYYGDKSDSVLHTLTYARKIGQVSLNASYQSGNDRDNRFFLNASIPFGRQATMSTQLQRYQNENSVASTFSHRPSNLWGYSVGVNRSQNHNRMSGSLNATTAYSQLSGSGSWNDENNHSMMVSASGALAYSNGLIATSPVALGDTFGILSVPGQAGVQINTQGGGTTLTNHFGTAAIPTLPINRKTTVQLDTKNLPLNVRLETTSFDVAVARGTIISREVKATVMKQLLLEISSDDGVVVPSGSSAVDDKGELMGVVMGNGNIMLSNEQIGKPITLRIANQADCLVEYPVPEHFDPNMLYEEASAICRK
ncbi:fimbria/pilus outer membrane usher protein [Providencia rettgeri]|nr:fimbria/pilus outer membrane usher protein [Providencia rettgeri]